MTKLTHRVEDTKDKIIQHLDDPYRIVSSTNGIWGRRLMKKSACVPMYVTTSGSRKTGWFAKIASNFIRKKPGITQRGMVLSGMIYYRCDTKIRCLRADIILYTLVERVSCLTKEKRRRYFQRAAATALQGKQKQKR